MSDDDTRTGRSYVSGGYGSIQHRIMSTDVECGTCRRWFNIEAGAHVSTRCPGCRELGPHRTIAYCATYWWEEGYLPQTPQLEGPRA